MLSMPSPLKLQRRRAQGRRAEQALQFYGISLFGLVSAACFLPPGLKYFRQRARTAVDR
jgi:hypothetical protein